MGQLREGKRRMEHRPLAPDLVVSDNYDACGNQCVGEPASNVAQEELFQEKQVGRPVNCSDSELSTYLQALEAGFLPTFYSDTSQSAQSKSMNIASRSYQRGKKTVVFHGFPSLQMSRNLTAPRGAGMLMSSAPASHARTSAALALARELTANAPASGAKWCALPVRYDRASSGWKTAHSLWEEGLPECSVTLPAWGCMHGGELWERMTWERPTSGSACGWLPTPTKTDANGRTYHYSRGDKAKAVPSLVGVVKLLPTPAATDWKGQYTWETVKKRMAMARGVRLPEELSRRVGKAITPNPEFWEWMMGWPIGSTALQPLAMDKFRQWRRLHGGF